jgi:hypothetical protein
MDDSSIIFNLPSNDSQLVKQVVVHIDENSEIISISDMLVNMSRKYRFAGYIGTLEHLFQEIKMLRDELDELKSKNKKRSWF